MPPDAEEAIFTASQGIPRRINLLRLTVVLVRPDGTRPPPLRVARTDAARAGLVHYLLAIGRDVHAAVAERERLVGRLRGQRQSVRKRVASQIALTGAPVKLKQP